MALVRSVCSPVCGGKAVVSLRSIPNFPVVSFHKSEVNSVPLAVMISCGSLCSLTISFVKRVANCCGSSSFQDGMEGHILDTLSTTTCMVSYPSDFGRSVMKSIAIDFHRQLGAVFDCCNPWGAFRTTLVL